VHLADQLEAWADESDLDGFNLAYAVMPETFADVVDLVVPELQRRGLFKTEYRPGTYRDKLFGNGPRLGERHPAARHRQQARQR
jgi:alkanesulfonate monooxygenase